MIEIISGDLMNATETYLCHQCNCITNRSAHLAKAVFKQFPYADVYTKREKPSQPGTIEICGSNWEAGGKGYKERPVIAMFGQYYPGKTKYPSSKKDGLQARLNYFEACLERMKHLDGSFAFPWRIGCGAAGGDWEKYLNAIKNFSEKNSLMVNIYRLGSEKQQKMPKLF